jgi:SAM-dependent methyltransferase
MIKSLEEKVAQIYDDRISASGPTITSLGWGSVESQRLRFEILLRNLSLDKKRILDVGCGFGDLAIFLDELGVKKYQYFGIDVSREAIDYCKIRFVNQPEYGFDVLTLSELRKANQTFDVVFMSGIFSLNISGMQQYAIDTIRTALAMSNEVVSVNFLSTLCDYQSSKDQHYSPCEIYSELSQLCGALNLYHDYPLYEFTVQAFKRRGTDE